MAAKRQLTLFQCAQGTSKRPRTDDLSNEDGTFDFPDSSVDDEPAHTAGTH